MNGSTGYKGWDDRRLPVELEPTPWARWVRRGGIFSLVLVVAMIGVGLWTEMYASPIVIMLVFMLLIAAMGQVGQRERFDRLVPTRLTLGLCPQCLYRLDGVPREEDNATVCPECGAAWVLPGKAKKS